MNTPPQFLLATNVLSELRRSTPKHPSVHKWWQEVGPHRAFISVLTVGEIVKGARKLHTRDPLQAGVFYAWLQRITSEHRERILPITQDIAEVWGNIGAEHSLPTADGLIAATALVHELTVVTRNTKDFQKTGAHILNPFSV